MWPCVVGFLQPHLKDLTLSIQEGHDRQRMLCDEFVIEVKSRCKTLSRLTLIMNPGCDDQLSPTVVTDFFQNMQFVRELRWCTGKSKLICSEVLMMLAHNPVLQLLKLNKIEDDWIADLCFPPQQSLFPALRDLECTISSTSLRAILPILNNLTELTINPSPG